MLEDEINNLIARIYLYFLEDKPKPTHGILIKKHSTDLHKQGELSFPNNVKCWEVHLKHEESSKESNLMKYLNKESDNLIMESKTWTLSIERIIEINDRVFLFLERPKAIKNCFLNCYKNNEVLINTLKKEISPVLSDPIDNSSKCITSMRVCCLNKVIQNLYRLNNSKDNVTTNIYITSRTTTKFGNDKIILCGTVLNSVTGVKETTIDADEFVRLRQAELTLIAQHKYGVRVSTESNWTEFLSNLGKSAVNFELLQTKPSSAVKIKFDSSSGSSKRAAFVLYNCARLETILRTYNEKVENGTYPNLPTYEEVDFSLLKQEDEWNLIFNFILGFPSFLKTTVDLENGRFEFKPHLICTFLSTMVGVFSQYYRRVRILTVNKS